MKCWTCKETDGWGRMAKRSCGHTICFWFRRREFGEPQEPEHIICDLTHRVACEAWCAEHGLTAVTLESAMECFGKPSRGRGGTRGGGPPVPQSLSGRSAQHALGTVRA